MRQALSGQPGGVRGRLLHGRRPEVPGADLPPAQPDRPRGPRSTWPASRRCRPQLKPDEVCFGVFLRVENKADNAIASAGDFTHPDTQGNTFRPVPLDNTYAYKAESVTAKDGTQPNGIEPAPTTRPRASSCCSGSRTPRSTTARCELTSARRTASTARATSRWTSRPRAAAQRWSIARSTCARDRAPRCPRRRPRGRAGPPRRRAGARRGRGVAREPGVGVGGVVRRLVGRARSGAPAGRRPCGSGTSSWSRSSAVPVLPATCTPGSAAAVPVPWRTTPSMSFSTVRAVAGEVARPGDAAGASPAAPPGSVRRSRGRRPRSPIVPRHDGHLQRRRLQPALADRGRAHGEVVADLVRRGDRRGRGARDPRRGVEPEVLGRGHEPLGAELRAERGEDRVARLREARWPACRRTTPRWRSRSARPRASPRSGWDRRPTAWRSRPPARRRAS